MPPAIKLRNCTLFTQFICMYMHQVNLTIDIGLYNAVLFGDSANRGSYVASVIEE
jgi:hypothetical protein